MRGGSGSKASQLALTNIWKRGVAALRDAVKRGARFDKGGAAARCAASWHKAAPRPPAPPLAAPRGPSLLSTVRQPRGRVTATAPWGEAWDEYGWMADVTSPEAETHIDEEREYTRRVLEPSRPFRLRVEREVAARLRGEHQTLSPEQQQRRWSQLQQAHPEAVASVLAEIDADDTPELMHGYWLYSRGSRPGGGREVAPSEAASVAESAYSSTSEVEVEGSGDGEQDEEVDASTLLLRRRNVEGASEEVLVDFSKLAGPTGGYAHVSSTAVSPDGELLVATIDTTGSEVYRARFVHIASGVELLGETIPSVCRVAWAGAGARQAQAQAQAQGQPQADAQHSRKRPRPWRRRRQHSQYAAADPTQALTAQAIAAASGSAAGRTVYYTVPDRGTNIATRVYRRCLGRRQGARGRDELVFAESERGAVLDVVSCKDGTYLTININTKTRSEVWILDSHDATAKPRLVHKREQGLQYFMEHNKGYFYIVTNADGATNYKVMRTPVTALGKEHWEEVLPYDDTVHVEDLDMFADCFVLYERANGQPRVSVVPIPATPAPGHEPPQFQRRPVELPEGTCQIEPGANLDFDSTSVRFSTTTVTAPEAVLDMNLDTLHRTQVDAGTVGGLPRFDADNYVCELLSVPSHDNAMVPLTVVRRRDTVLHGSNPLLLEGYGAYGIHLDASFEPQRLAFLDRGWVVAFAHVRGGGELGRDWCTQGRVLYKHNSFADYVACADALVERGYSCPRLMAGRGHSAGGLIMGYIANNHPNLLRAVIMKAPFLDVLGDMMDPSRPLTEAEYEDWGNPAADEAVRAYMARYSPYDNVGEHEYPAILATGAEADIRVTPDQPLRYVARVRRLRTGGPSASDHEDASRLGVHTLEQAWAGSAPPACVWIQSQGGHFGDGGVARETAVELAFLHLALGLPIS